jgi:two-component system OmpR family sensor kinase
MLRILIRLYLIVATLSIFSIVFVQKSFPYLFASEFKAEMRQEYTSEAMLLRSYLGPIQDAQQQARLDRMNQLSPGRYNRLSADQKAALPPSIKRELAHYQMAWTGSGSNDRWNVYITLEDGGVLEIRSHLFGTMEFIAYIVIFSVMLGAMVMWLIPHWRDLEKLRIAAARFGAGALDARVKLSENSSVRQLCTYFNNMADRIGKLITAQRDMVNAASHELRTPLARLEFGLVNLMDNCDDSNSHKRIQAMRKDVKELDALVAELLTLSMLEQSALPERVGKIMLEDFLRSAAGVSDEELSLRHNTIVWLLAPSMKEVITAPRSLGRAFSNLIQNALRYSRSTIRVRTEANAGSWNLIVEDDGVGIPEAERERIFEAFYRLDRSRDRATGGHGLGLAIVKKIVEGLGGSIRVNSSDLGGAMFVLNFPVPGK